MGHDFAERTWFLQVVLGFACLLDTWTMVPMHTIMGMGHSKIVAIFSLISAIINTILVLVFTAAYGILGASLGVLFSQLTVPVLIWYVTKKILIINWKKYIHGVFIVNLLPLSVFLALSLAVAPVCKVLNITDHLIPFAIEIGLVVLYFVLAICLKIIPIPRLGDFRTPAQES